MYQGARENASFSTIEANQSPSSQNLNKNKGLFLGNSTFSIFGIDNPQQEKLQEINRCYQARLMSQMNPEIKFIPSLNEHFNTLISENQFLGNHISQYDTECHQI